MWAASLSARVYTMPATGRKNPSESHRVSGRIKMCSSTPWLQQSSCSPAARQGGGGAANAALNLSSSHRHLLGENIYVRGRLRTEGFDSEPPDLQDGRWGFIRFAGGAAAALLSPSHRKGPKGGTAALGCEGNRCEDERYLEVSSSSSNTTLRISPAPVTWKVLTSQSQFQSRRDWSF